MGPELSLEAVPGVVPVMGLEEVPGVEPVLPLLHKFHP